jgi:hypothetical protein
MFCIGKAGGDVERIGNSSRPSGEKELPQGGISDYRAINPSIVPRTPRW